MAKPNASIDIRARIVPEDKKAECVTPTCGNLVATSGRRGLCGRCYNAASLLVAMGETTWKKLEKAGKAVPPPLNRDRARVSWFLSK